jgi:hypothetical protein
MSRGNPSPSATRAATEDALRDAVARTSSGARFEEAHAFSFFKDGKEHGMRCTK